MIGTSKRLLAGLLAVLLIGAGTSLALAQPTAPRPQATRQAQQGPSPVPLQFPTSTATQGPPSETPTRTATSEGRPYVEAISNETNVRAGPDIGENRVGLLYPGTTYAVLGRVYEWYQIEFPGSPTGTAWVHNSVVTLFGDESLIVEIEPQNIPTLPPEFIAAQQTADFVSATPGALLTLTARVLITPTGIFTPEPGSAVGTLPPGVSLPTFTYPPYSPTPLIIQRTNPPPETSSGFPPLLPILALGALGLMGLLVSFMRRL